eukprot:8131672-Alexandrium_andersonii.AAC.1
MCIRDRPRHKAARSSQKPGIRQQLDNPGFHTQPWGCRAKGGAPSAGETCSALWRGSDRSLVQLGAGSPPSFSRGANWSSSCSNP